MMIELQNDHAESVRHLLRQAKKSLRCEVKKKIEGKREPRFLFFLSLKSLKNIHDHILFCFLRFAARQK